MKLLTMSMLTRRAKPAAVEARARRHRHVAAPVHAAPVHAAAVPASITAPADEAEPAPRCGWFDSSHELRSGLVVTELEQPESVARVVPLSWWLQWQLQG